MSRQFPNFLDTFLYQVMLSLKDSYVSIPLMGKWQKQDLIGLKWKIFFLKYSLADEAV